MISVSLKKYQGIEGWIAIALYCIFTSFSAVWVSLSFTKINGTTLTFFTLFIAQVVFLVMSIIKKEKPIRFLVNNLTSIFWLNILTLTSWLFMFMALQRIEASVESAIYQGWIPVIVIVLSVMINKKPTSEVIGPILIAISIFLLVTVRMYSVDTENINLIEGIILASVAGGTGGIYVYISSRLKNRQDATTMNILATRFVILLAVTAFFSRYEIIQIASTDWVELIKLSTLSLLFVVIPVFCLQHAILELGAIRVSMLTPLVPVIALGAEYVISPWKTPWVPLMIAVVCLCIVISNFRMNR